MIFQALHCIAQEFHTLHTPIRVSDQPAPYTSQVSDPKDLDIRGGGKLGR